MAAVLGLRCDPASNYPSDLLGVVVVPVIGNQSEAGSFQLIEVPEITSATGFAQPDDKKIVTTALDQNSLVSIGQQPYVASRIRGFVARQSRSLYLLWLHLQ